MRNSILLSIFIFLAFTGFAQKTPAVVLKSFEAKYPDTEVLEWEFFGGTYTASFFRNNDYTVSIFDGAGNWLKSTRQIKEDQLPMKVKKCWHKKYKDVQFVTAVLEVLENSKKPRYHISFESSKNLVNLVYNRRGRVKKKFSEPILLD